MKVAKLIEKDAVDDDDDEEDEEADVDGMSILSETSSLVGNRRSRSAHSSLPTSRKPSPSPVSRAHGDDTFVSRVQDAVSGALGQRRQRANYRALSDQ